MLALHQSVRVDWWWCVCVCVCVCVWGGGEEGGGKQKILEHNF